MTRIFVLVFVTFISTSCFIIEEYETASIAQNEPEKREKQEIIQDSIVDYLTKQYRDGASYKAYTFGSLYSNKPQEIVELEQLYEIKRMLPPMQQHYGNRLDSVMLENDNQINTKNKEIRENRIFTTYDLTHLYCIKDSLDNFEIVETQFLLYPNYKIKDLKLVFSVTIDKRELELFEHFIHQDPLVFDNDYNYQKKMNAHTYAKLNKSMINALPEKKGALLKTILKKVKFYQMNNGFDADIFANFLLSEWSKTPTLNVSIEEVIKSSKLKMIKGKSDSLTTDVPYETLLGYKKFLLVKGTWEKKIQEEKALYCEFDNNLVLLGVLPVEGDFEKYFE